MSLLSSVSTLALALALGLPASLVSQISQQPGSTSSSVLGLVTHPPDTSTIQIPHLRLLRQSSPRQHTLQSSQPGPRSRTEDEYSKPYVQEQLLDSHLHPRPTIFATPVELATFTDTLKSLLGYPQGGLRHLGPSSPAPGIERAAEYTEDKDQIVIYTLSFRPSALFMHHFLAHEWWHMAQARVAIQLDSLWSTVPRPSSDNYAASSPAEQQAEAFASALLWLQSTRLPSYTPQTRALASSHLDTMDVEIPGTRQFVSILLSHPLFADHPLNTGVLRYPLAPPVATPPFAWGDITQTPSTAPSRRLNMAIYHIPEARLYPSY